MKEELLKYTCDFCGNTITVQANNYAGTPLHHRWLRLYRLEHPVHTAKTKYHFCADRCASNFLNKFLPDTN